MKLKKLLAGGSSLLAATIVSAGAAFAACATDNLPAKADKPEGEIIDKGTGSYERQRIPYRKLQATKDTGRGRY